MTRKLFSIGRIGMEIECPGGYTMVFDPAMERFSMDQDIQPDMSYRVETIREGTVVSACEELFSSTPGGLWSIYDCKDIGSYIITLQSLPEDSEPYLIVVADRGFRRFRVHLYPDDAERVFPLQYPVDELTISGFLNINRMGVLLHSACIKLWGRGILFSGTSGSGKSTISDIWQKDTQAEVLTDERVIIRYWENQLYAFGTPWHGTGEVHKNAGAPVERIYFLKHGGCNRARRLSRVDATNRLLVRCFPTFWHREGMQFALDFCSLVASEVQCYELEFTPDPSVIGFVKKHLHS